MSDRPSPERRVEIHVNGEAVALTLPVRENLVDVLRYRLGLTGTHIGCEHGSCGACTMRVAGVPVRGCLMLAVQADGLHVETIEGLAQSGEIADLQAAFVACNALQCGFCTPGMLVTAAELLSQPKPMSRAAIRAHISGNYCRCTGYQSIVDAIETTLHRRIAQGGAE